MRIPDDLLAFGIMASILGVLMFASVTIHSNIQHPPPAESAAANSR